MSDTDTPITANAQDTAMLFPGQGSQTDTMREVVEREWPELLERAVQEVGDDPFARLEEGTRFAQPAVYCASLAAWSRLAEPEPSYLAGHSLGEFAALVAAGAIDWADGLRLVVLRGRLMQEADERRPDGGGGMLVLRGDREFGEPIAARHGVTVANDNAPSQVVLSGPEKALEAAAADAKRAGARAKRLPIVGAFHSPAMASAVPEFAAALAATPFAEPRRPVLSCVIARPFDDVRQRLADALTLPVRWRETVLALRDLGVRRFVDTGPGTVLAGLVRRTLHDVEIVAADGMETSRA